MKTIEELKELKAIGISYYKDEFIEVRFDLQAASQEFKVVPSELKEQPEARRLTIEDELFNQ